MKQALLIIDVQNDYFKNGRCELHHPEIALAAVKELQNWFRKKDLPIYYVQHISRENADFFLPGTEGAELAEALHPRNNEKIIPKRHPNAFLDTELQMLLSEAGITDLVICGMMTHMCVDTTVRAAYDLGCQVTLISDACATRPLFWNGEEIPADVVQKVFLASMDGIFARIMTAGEFLAEQGARSLK